MMNILAEAAAIIAVIAARRLKSLMRAHPKP